MRKEFNQDDLAYWYAGIYACFWCGKTDGDAFHHVDTDGDYSDSLLNAALLNNFNCHINIHSKLRKPENVKILLEKILAFLLSKGYKFTEIDKKFIEQHKETYKDILKTRTTSV